MSESHEHSSRVADVLVSTLLGHGIDRVFCVPGESFLTVLDAFHGLGGAIDVVTCRHEAGAAHMAEAYAKLTGRPGVCFVTRGPGAAHAAIGVHTARQDSTPLILFVGQVARSDKDREAFQEVDYTAVFGSMTKWSAEVADPARMQDYVERALLTATAGRPGPVVLSLPEDVLDEPGAPLAPFAAPATPPAASPALVEALRGRLARAERPLVLAGGSGWSAQACHALQALVEAAGLPVALSFRRKHLLDNESPAYAGDLGLGVNPRLVAAVRESDLIIAVGARLSENAMQGYSLLTRSEAARKLVHLHPGAEEIGRVYPASLAAALDPAAAVEAIGAALPGRGWSAWCAARRADYEAFSTPIAARGAVNPAKLIAELGALLPPEAIITNGAGNYAGWLHRFFRHRRFGGQVAPTSGAMGYGLPAAIAAKLAAPERPVVAFAGDGCFLMSVQELATAAQRNLSLLVIVFDNSSYGTIRMHQARRFPGRVEATGLLNPDFCALARSFGAWAAKVERDEEVGPCLAEALSREGLKLLQVKIDLEDIAPGQSLAAIERV